MIPDIFSFLWKVSPTLIGIYLVWVSQLRGARIELLERPSVQVFEIPENYFKNSIPAHLELRDISLLFLNKGNKAGIVKDVVCNFKPSKDFEPFLGGEAIFYAEYASSNDPYEMLKEYRIIDDRGVGVVLIKSYGLRLRDELSNTIKDANLNLLRITNNNLPLLVKEILNYKKRVVEDFVSFLDGRKSFGEVKISYTYSGKKLWISEGLKKEKFSLEVPNNLDDTVKRYHNLLENWDKITPALPDIIEDLTRYIESHINAITSNRDLLIEKKGEIAKLRNYGTHQDIDRKWEYQLLTKWEKYSDFMIKLKSLSDSIMEHIRETEKLHPPDSVTYKSYLGKSLEKQDYLETETNEVLSELENLRNELYRELERTKK